MANFTDILNKPMDDIKAPAALPVGTYLGIVDGPPEIGEKGKNKNGAATFSIKLMQAQPDVDQEALMTALEGKSLTDVKLKHTLWLTQDAAWRAKQFIEDHLGVQASSLAEGIAQSPGRQVLLTLGHRTSEDGTQVFSDIKSTAKA